MFLLDNPVGGLSKCFLIKVSDNRGSCSQCDERDWNCPAVRLRLPPTGDPIYENPSKFCSRRQMGVAWTDDIPGALTQGATLEEARENLIDAVRMIREPVDLSKLPKNKIVIEQLEV